MKTEYAGKYLLSRALFARRRLVAYYRKAYGAAKAGEASPEQEAFIEGFYSVEKLLIVTIKELDTERRVKLPCLNSGEPRIMRLAFALADMNADNESAAEYLKKAQEGNSFKHSELDRLKGCVRLAGLLRLAEYVDGKTDAAELSGMLLELKKKEELAWNELIEEASAVIKILKQNAGFGKLDKESRAVLVDKLLRLADQLKTSETEAAEKAVSLSGEEDVSRFILGADEGRLRTALSPKRPCLPIDANTAFVMFLSAFILLTLGISGAFFRRGALMLILALFPAASISLSILTTVFSMLFSPRRLPRLEIVSCEGENSTSVAVPVLLTDPDSVHQAVKALETHYLSNPLEGVSYILLADLIDSKTKTLETDEELLESAKAGVDRLNEKYGGRFFLLARERTENHDGVFQGHERKRGAVMELCRMLNGGENSFSTTHPPIVPRANYLVVLDADTVMPPGTLKKLVGAAAHPMNRPVIENGRVQSGYTVFAPRMRTTALSASKSFFSRVFSGDTGYELYSSAVSNLHMDAYSEGDFGGKGIICVKAFLELLSGRIPDNAVLSHDLLEGSYARTAYLDDVALYDGEPSTLPKWWKRQERWIRGDWQLLPFIFGKGLSAINRAKMLGNLFRSLREPILFLLTLYSCIAGSAPLLLLTVFSLLFEPVKGFILLALSSMKERSSQERWLLLVLRTLTELAALPYSALTAGKAIAVALFRTFISHKKMLLWTTASSAKADEGPFACSCGLSAAALTAAAAYRMLTFGVESVAVMSLVIASIWFTAPALIRRLDKTPKKKELNDSERRFISERFQEAWRYFELECGERTNWLPPDNVQGYPQKPFADLTSPTDVGMGLMALVSAHDAGILDDVSFIDRTQKTLISIAGLEKWHGLPFNWYRVTDMRVLSPRFVSSVDSGNLAASLMAAEAALRELEQYETASLAQRLFDEMELSMLYDERKKLFHIGFDAEECRLTPAYYDLFASEARILSFVAIVKNDAPLEHWNALSRLAKDAAGGRTLISWSGTAFEYLMPFIFFGSLPGTLQYETALSAVRTQLLNAEESRPWGFSEAGYYAFDKAMNYQYRAFGEPSLALEPRREKHIVVAPYASALALYIEPEEAVKNLEGLMRTGAVGKYGFYESLDYADGAEPRTVASFMAHHKGMELCAYASVLTDNRMVKRFMAIPRVRAMEQLLYENLPLTPIIIREYESSVIREPAEKRDEPFPTRKGSEFTYDGVLLSNGERYVHVFSDGSSVSGIGKTMLADGVSILVDGRELTGECLLQPHMASFSENRNELGIRLRVLVASMTNAEIRIIDLVNRGHDTEKVVIGAFFRPLLVSAREFEAHPAFVRLTVDAEKAGGGVLFRLRRKRGRKEQYQYAALFSDTEASYSSGAYSFPGRLITPSDALASGKRPEFESRPVEPCFSAAAEIVIGPTEHRQAVFVMGAENDREKALHALDKLRKTYSDEEALAALVASGILREAGMKRREAMELEPLFARLARRIPFRTDETKDTGLGVKALWELGLSGDKPIVTVHISTKEQLVKLNKLSSFLKIAEIKGFEADVCVLSALPTAYGDRSRTKLKDMLGDRARIFDEALLRPELKDALSSMSLVYAEADKLPFAPALKRRLPKVRRLKTEPLPRRRLMFDNGVGGFDAEKEEYVIYGKTPAPWSNVIANERFGTLVTENGGGYTWADNSRLLRLTPWSCDPISDPAHERVTVSLEDGTFGLMPYGSNGEYEISHGLGYTVSHCKADGLEAELCQFVGLDEPVKYYLVRIRNTSSHDRRLGLSLSVDWCVGETPREGSLIFEERGGAVFVRSKWQEDDGRRAFAAGDSVSGGTAGINLDLIPGESVERVFVLGFDKPEAVLKKLDAIRSPENARMELAAVKDAWRERLGRLDIRTGNDEWDIIINRLLLYQTYSARLFARTGFYQSGGAVGFRDRLQDALALLMTEPMRAREIIIDSAAHQFIEGDVLHWWHGKAKGVRTRISDDRLFLPYVCIQYAKETGDASVWDAEAPFLTGEPLKESERDRYAEFEWGEETGSIFEHCLCAVAVSMKTGKNGLPLMGTGDWNDGFDEVGGESVFVGWLMLVVLDGFVTIVEARGDKELARRLMLYADALKTGLEKTWEGDRYLRAIWDDGEKLGSRGSKECSMDLLSAVWAVFARAEHAEEAFDTALGELFDERHSVIKLLSPPFTDTSEKSAGYIEAYSEGLRENGGQYSHAGAWAVIAACMMNRPALAERLITALDPIEHGSRLNVMNYRTEPYAVAGDIGGFGENIGRGGWTWYTGASAWMYRAFVNHVLGIKKTGRTLKVEPVTTLDTFDFTYRFGSSVYIVHAVRSSEKKGEEILLSDDGGAHELTVYYQ